MTLRTLWNAARTRLAQASGQQAEERKSELASGSPSETPEPLRAWNHEGTTGDLAAASKTDLLAASLDRASVDRVSTPSGSFEGGYVTHLQRPVEFGAEKEFGPQSFTSQGSRLATSRPTSWNASLTQNWSAERFIGGGSQKPVAAREWSDLNDAGKAAWVAEFRRVNGRPPVLEVEPGSELGKLSYEPDGSIEFISHKLVNTQQLKQWLDKYGWGHVHTSFVRSGDPIIAKQQVNWVVMANQYMFLAALERRTASEPISPQDAGRSGGTNWPFAINTLSTCCQEHTHLWEQMFNGLTQKASSFSKHLQLNVRTGLYRNDQGLVNRDLIGTELRGGLAKEKERVLDALVRSLVTGRWGDTPSEFGSDGGFRLMVTGAGIGPNDSQVKSLPRDFETLAVEALAEGMVDGLSPNDAPRLFRFVNQARFYEGDVVSRLRGFDHRAGCPLLRYENLVWLPEEAKQRVVGARAGFLRSLADLELKAAASNMPSTEAAQRISALIIEWAKQVQLAESFGKWLDGPERMRVLS